MQGDDRSTSSSIGAQSNLRSGTTNEDQVLVSGEIENESARGTRERCDRRPPPDQPSHGFSEDCDPGCGANIDRQAQDADGQEPAHSHRCVRCRCLAEGPPAIHPVAIEDGDQERDRFEKAVEESSSPTVAQGNQGVQHGEINSSVDYTYDCESGNLRYQWHGSVLRNGHRHSQTVAEVWY